MDDIEFVINSEGKRVNGTIRRSEMDYQRTDDGQLVDGKWTFCRWKRE